MTNGSEGVSRPWEFAGWGRAERIDDIDTSVATPISHLDHTQKHKLGTCYLVECATYFLPPTSYFLLPTSH